MPSPVSVLIPVKNEIANIEHCIRSVEWADEIYVVDSNSTDGTIGRATALGAKVVQFAYTGSWPKKKNWALANLPFRNDWVLILDADERITPELRDEIAVAIQQPGFDGYHLNRRVIFLGRWIRHCGWYPSWNLRLFRHRLGRYEFLGEGTDEARTGDNEVHEHVVLQGRAGYLKHDMLHEDFRDLFHWLERHNRYSSWEARVQERLREPQREGQIKAGLSSPLQRKRLLRRIWVRLPFKPTLKFVYMYFFRLGFLDGRPGYYFCRIQKNYEFDILAKRYEIRLHEQIAQENAKLTGQRNPHVTES
ncbi:MAG: glycosyltransferase family 2 protein [Acidobacteria bacterium]|nr:glycosyltransferase family 2 protein [Acidobacteriota bacterium]